MLARDPLKTSVLRSLVAAFTNELVSKKRKPQEILTDEEALAVIRRASRQRKDSIDQFTAGGREDLATAERAELTHIDSFLPLQATDEEIEKVVRAKKSPLALLIKQKLGYLSEQSRKNLRVKRKGAGSKPSQKRFLGLTQLAHYFVASLVCSTCSSFTTAWSQASLAPRTASS